MKEKEFVLRDLRIRQHFIIDDEYLNGYARLCGINATGVYVSLCRHANFNTQSCFPSKKLIAEQLGISEKSVYTALKKLEEWNIIKKESQGRKKSGNFKNNIYFLVDKSQWKSIPETKNDTDTVGTCYPRPQVPVTHGGRYVVPNKDTDSKDSINNINNNINTNSGLSLPRNPELNESTPKPNDTAPIPPNNPAAPPAQKLDHRDPRIEELYQLGVENGFPRDKVVKGKNWERIFIRHLIETDKHPTEELKKLLLYSVKVRNVPMAPMIASWKDLRDKFVKLKAHRERELEKKRIADRG